MTPPDAARPTMPVPHKRFSGELLLVLPLLATACSAASTGTADPDAPPPGADVQTPFPIDRGGESAATPGTYKGLPLRLTSAVAPTVTPVDGIIGVVCVGMSNGNQECGDFQSRVRTEFAGQVSPAVRVVNCAVGGHAIERWIDASYDAVLWDRCIAEQLPAARVRLDQVRVLWHKAANQFTTGPGGATLPTYPSAGSDYESFTRNLTAFSRRARTKFPALQAVYTSSRSYGGFASSAARGEPLSYEEGHALNQWLKANPVVDGVWYGWGPYLWAPACGSGTNGSGICYDRADYVDDGVHPSPSGRAKVSRLLHARFREHAWYR